MTSTKDLASEKISGLVGAGKLKEVDTVDFSNSNRPKTCLEIDFPVLPINEISKVESSSGASRKPIYTMTKWWARRSSSVFRSLLIAAATKAPAESHLSAKVVWDNFYVDHQASGNYSSLTVADIFMGGGTTLIEGARLGMNMIGNDLNPVAWLIVKQELDDVDMAEVESLLADVEKVVKPQIMPYFACDGPDGEQGKWTHLPSGEQKGGDFNPLEIPIESRKDYRYDGPEIIYSFWAKHGPCQVTGCGHRTPIISRPVIAFKNLSISYWEHACRKCGHTFHVEQHSPRMAPDVPLLITEGEHSFSSLDIKKGAICPMCKHAEHINLGKSKKKTVELNLLVHPDWLDGSPRVDHNGKEYGGSAQDSNDSTSRWMIDRAKSIRLLEVRGQLPQEVTCPETGVTFSTKKANVPKKSHYACASCGTVQDVLATIKASKKTGPMAAYAIQGYSRRRDLDGLPYGGRFFLPFDHDHAEKYSAASLEWSTRKDTDLADFWPRSELPYGFMTHHLQGGVPNHGFTHWATMFSDLQKLILAQLLKAITTVGSHSWQVREFVLGAFDRYLQHQNLMCFWDFKQDCLAPSMSNNNYHPKSTIVENSVFSKLGRGNWNSSAESLLQALLWKVAPTDLVYNERLNASNLASGLRLSGKTTKVVTGGKVTQADISCCSSTDLAHITNSSVDLVITDPPFGGLIHYSELSDFFYVWLRLALKDKYRDLFSTEYTPKSLEAVSNRAREPEDPDGFYQRLLTMCWREAHRILKDGGILAFTFHHSEDEPWIAVLESLFSAGFYLEATYPIRSDETKGEGEFGSKTIEYDIIHVCRKRTEDPKPVSWGRMRREVLADVRQLQGLLENHAKAGLPAADIQVIRRGKALEYFSRHYGRVYVDDGRLISVKDALVGINQLIDEDVDRGKEPPPVNAEPITRQFLRTFGTSNEIKRDQLQKFLKGSITTPDDFVQRGWCEERKKIFTRTKALDLATEWSGKHKRRLISDLDQALVLIGSCYEHSGINAVETLRNENFKPHVALKPLLEWLKRHGPDKEFTDAASRAVAIFNSWATSQVVKPTQGSLFEGYET